MRTMNQVNVGGGVYDAANDFRQVEAEEASLPSDDEMDDNDHGEENNNGIEQLEFVHTHPRSPLLFEAFMEKNWDLANALIAENHGLQYISNNHNGITVLHAAVLNDAPPELLKMLLERGVNPNHRNLWGRTPVYLAARHDANPETLRLLVNAGGEINVRDNFTYTPLMASAYNGASLQVIGCVLALGGDLQLADLSNRTALHWARQKSENKYIVTYLENIPLVEALCSVFITRLGARSPLRVLSKDIFYALRDMLCLPRVLPPRREIPYDG